MHKHIKVLKRKHLTTCTYAIEPVLYSANLLQSKPAVLDSIAELYTTIESNSFPDDNDALDEEDPVIDCCNRDK